RAIATVVVSSEPRANGNHGLMVPTGIYVFEREALELVPSRGFCDLKEKLLPQLYRSGHQVSPYPTSSATPRVLGVSTYLAVNDWVVEHLIASGEAPQDYIRSGSSLLHPDAVVADDAVF